MLIVAGWAIALPLSAQAPPGRSEPVPPEIAPPVPADSAQIEEQKIDQFAQAYIAVEEIHTRATRELDTVEDPEVASRLKADAESRIIQAVERSGLKLDEFNQIAERMASDRDLRLRIADKVRELRRI
jgi:hypothetical protein